MLGHISTFFVGRGEGLGAEEAASATARGGLGNEGACFGGLFLTAQLNALVRRRGWSDPCSGRGASSEVLHRRCPDRVRKTPRTD